MKIQHYKKVVNAGTTCRNNKEIVNDCQRRNHRIQLLKRKRLEEISENLNKNLKITRIDISQEKVDCFKINREVKDHSRK